MSADLTDAIYHDEAAARAHLEAQRWPNGPVCPHCKGTNAPRMVSSPESKNQVRDGLLKCRDCRKKFTVTVGTIFEHSHIPLNKWLLATFLLCSSKKGTFCAHPRKA